MKTHWLIEVLDGVDYLWYSKEISIEGQSIQLLATLPSAAEELLINGIQNIRVTRLHERSRNDSVQISASPELYPGQ